MIWYQPLLGPLEHDLIAQDSHCQSQEALLALGRIAHVEKSRARALSAFSTNWSSANQACKIIGVTPQALRKQAQHLVDEGKLEVRYKQNSNAHLEWRVKNEVSDMRWGEQGNGHKTFVQEAGVPCVQVKVENNRDSKGRFCKN